MKKREGERNAQKKHATREFALIQLGESGTSVWEDPLIGPLPRCWLALIRRIICMLTAPSKYVLEHNICFRSSQEKRDSLSSRITFRQQTYKK